MNPWVPTVAIAGLFVACNAPADDSMTRSSMTQEQAMKDCIEQQKTTGVNMSKAQMKRMCKDKLKEQKTTGDMPEQPAADAPHN